MDLPSTEEWLQCEGDVQETFPSTFRLNRGGTDGGNQPCHAQVCGMFGRVWSGEWSRAIHAMTFCCAWFHTQVSFPERMEPPIFVYYELENMYQNHLVYFGSENIKQLHGDLEADTTQDCK